MSGGVGWGGGVGVPSFEKSMRFYDVHKGPPSPLVKNSTYCRILQRTQVSVSFKIKVHCVLLFPGSFAHSSRVPIDSLIIREVSSENVINK